MSIVAETATLAHGYTMAHVDNFAWKAAWRYRVSTLPLDDAHDVAWHAVVELLYSSDEYVPRNDLMTAAVSAVAREVREHHQNHGIDADTGWSRPSFGKYWLPVAGPLSDFTEHLVERIALPQILAVLTDTEYEAIATLAAHGNGKDAAAALQIKDKTFYERVRRARMKAVAAWFDTEEPAQKSTIRSDGTEQCRAGHSRAEYGTLLPTGWWKCRLCIRATARRQMARNR